MKLVATHAFALILGGVFLGWGQCLLGIGPFAGPSITPPSRGGLESSAAPRETASKQPPKTQEQPKNQSLAAGKQPDIDPVAEAQRINEINRRNMQRMGGGPSMPGRPARPQAYGPRPGVPQPPMPGIPAAPGLPGGEEEP
jgi:hypothetical protein